MPVSSHQVMLVETTPQTNSKTTSLIQLRVSKEAMELSSTLIPQTHLPQLALRVVISQLINATTRELTPTTQDKK